MSEPPVHPPGHHSLPEQVAAEAVFVATEAVAAVRRIPLRTRLAIVAISVLAGLAALLVAVRYGALLPQAQLLIEAGADGLKVGRVGRIRIEGLSGDIFRDVRVTRLTISDEGGVWLEADNVHMTWSYLELLRRRFHARKLEVETLKLLRRPTLTAKGQDSGLPLSFHIDQAHGRVEMTPAFSYERGLYDLALNIDVDRNGDQRGQVRVGSLLHPGDYLNIDYDLAAKRPLVLRIDGEEAQGGALAGALGLPARQPFLVEATASGKLSSGHFDAFANSGSTNMLKAVGSWTPSGGVARGFISLTASALTDRYAQRFGPRVSFVLAGQQAGKDLYALDGRLASENLDLRASGFGDLGKGAVGPQGLALTAATQGLSRITGGPQIGPARLVGRITQAQARGRDVWNFSGAATVSKANLGAYSLAEVTGPVTASVTAGQWDLKARLVGSGGAGAGYATAMLGAAPRANVDASRLADGRLLLRELSLTGAGLKLDVSGERGLLGGIGLKGKAVVSNLATARAGAAGTATLDAQAGQGRAGQPWNLGLEAHGARFATGYPELDRLLGGKPDLKAQGSWQAGRLALTQASLNGAALSASGSGALSPDTGLAFRFDWSADGPFHAGPVEVAGRAKGSGTLAGTLAAPRADLSADIAQIDAPRLPLKDAHLALTFQKKPDGSAGSFALDAASAYGPARARADFRFLDGGIELANLSLDAGGIKASGALSLRRNTPSAADLQLTIGRGVLLDGGLATGAVKIADAPGGARANVQLAGQNLTFPGQSLTLTNGRITASGPLAQLPYSAQAAGRSDAGAWTFSGQGVLSDANPGWLATYQGQVGLGRHALATTETAQFRFGGPERSARMRLASADGGRIDLDGRINGAGADIRLQATGLTLDSLDEDLAGKADGLLTLQGRGSRLEGNLEARIAGLRARGARPDSGVDGILRGHLAGDSLSLDLTSSNAQGMSATANLVLPAESSAAPFRVAIARQKPIRGRFQAKGEVRPLWDLLVGGERSLSGQVAAQGTLGGTLERPTADGGVTVAGGRFDDGATGLSLRNVALRAVFDRDAVNITDATGVDGHGGALSGAGTINLEHGGASSFRMDVKGFRLIDNDMAVVSATGRATIDRSADGKTRLAGALTIDRADVAARVPTPSGVVLMDVVEKNRPAELPSALPPANYGNGGWSLDLTLKATRGVFLKGHGLDAELSLDAHVTGTSSHPQLTGVSRVVRGDYQFAGKRFEFDNTGVVYLSTRPELIRLDLTATRDDPTLTAAVRIRGTAARPEITLTSTPALPNDEVLSQVLFGRTASQLSPLEAAQLASALSSLAGGGGLDVIGNLRTLAGLDRLALGGGDALSGPVSVSGGKYLNDNVYLELTGGGRDGGAAQVEWRVKKSLSIISRIGGQGDGRLAVRWRKDY